MPAVEVGSGCPGQYLDAPHQHGVAAYQCTIGGMGGTGELVAASPLVGQETVDAYSDWLGYTLPPRSCEASRCCYNTIETTNNELVLPQEPFNMEVCFDTDTDQITFIPESTFGSEYLRFQGLDRVSIGSKGVTAFLGQRTCGLSALFFNIMSLKPRCTGANEPICGYLMGDLTIKGFLDPEADPLSTPDFTYSDWSDWIASTQTCVDDHEHHQHKCIDFVLPTLADIAVDKSGPEPVALDTPGAIWTSLEGYDYTDTSVTFDFSSEGFLHEPSVVTVFESEEDHTHVHVDNITTTFAVVTIDNEILNTVTFKFCGVIPAS